ncbi:Vacuolar protein sorting-associated protein 53 [Phlyctochytrium planicorne]|nr:Vacuolar protein sorting-associated protein 53 [Phlyctochytrium planicorne]
MASTTTTSPRRDSRSLASPAAAVVVEEKGDPLDSPLFDPIVYVNEFLPNEQSLENIDTVLRRLEGHMQQIDRDLRDMLRQQTDGGTRSEKELEQCKMAIQQLFNRIKEIRSKATESEHMVHEITRDIQNLDNCKKNLLKSNDVLKRLQVFVVTMDHLKTLFRKRCYLEASEILYPFFDLVQYFESMRNVAQIAVLCERVSQFKVDIQRQILGDFEEGILRGNVKTVSSLLYDACRVIEILGPDVRKQLLDWYCDAQLKDYRNIFRQNTEVAGLDSVSRRYAWLKRSLKTFDEEHAAIFPIAWNVAEILCETFCNDARILTTGRVDISGILTRTESTLDVKMMLLALQQTMEFESKLESRFVDKSPTALSPGEERPRNKFFKIISSAFEPFLRLYIESEDRNLSDMIDAARTSIAVQEDELVFTSSTDLFLFYRQTLMQCSKFSTNKPFLDLCRLFGKWLRVYGDVLSSKLPRDDKKTYTEEEMRIACLIINTADYCSQTTSQLEEKLIDKIDEKFKSTVNFGQETEGFLNVTSVAIKSLVHMVEVAAEPSLTVMAKKQWASLESVGDQSEYVTQLGTQIISLVTLFRKTLSSSKYLRTFWDKFSEALLNRYHSNIFKCKPISEVGAEQMLLDTHAMKTILVQMTNAGVDADQRQPPPPAYLKLLGKGVLKIEQLLKVVLRSHDPPGAIVETYILLFPEGDSQQFQKILDLKGLKRAEQLSIVDVYNTRTGNAPTATTTTTTTQNIMQSATSSFQASFSSGGNFKNKFFGGMQGFKRDKTT